jgi:hypothetical protein
MQRFVCVRVLRMNDVDLALFQFDYDLTWMGFFLGPDGRVYSRYGGRDAESDEGRLSLKGLKTTMRRVLARHEELAGAEPPPAHKPQLPADLFPVRRDSCLHCHQVWEGLRERDRKAGRFDPASLDVYPLPENIGVELDVDAGSRVLKILAKSPAERAKILPGDELRRIADVELLSQGDVQWALHNAPAKGPLTVELVREGRRLKLTLELPPGWRKTDQSWRRSILSEPEGG